MILIYVCMTITFTVAVETDYEPPELLVEPDDQYVFDDTEVRIVFIRDQSKFTVYLGRVLGKICLKKSLRTPYFFLKKSLRPPFFS